MQENSIIINLKQLKSRFIFKFNESRSFHVQKYHDASYIVNHALFFLPSFERSSHQIFSRSLRIFLQIERIHYFGDVDILQELPHPVTCNYHNLIVFLKSVLTHFWFSIAADRVCHSISERSCHCKTWHVLCLEPDSQWPERISMVISVRINPTIIINDSFCLVLIVGFVISC